MPGENDDVVISGSGSTVEEIIDIESESGIDISSLTIGAGASLEMVEGYSIDTSGLSNAGEITVGTYFPDYNLNLAVGAQFISNSGVMYLEGNGSAAFYYNNGQNDGIAVINNSGTINAIDNYLGDNFDTSGLVFNSDAKLIGGGKIILVSGYIATEYFATEKLENKDNTISGSGQFIRLQFTNDVGGTIDANGASSLYLNTGNIFVNAGLMESTVNTGHLVIDDAVTNTGTIEGVNQGDVEVSGTVTGGTLEANAGGFLDLNGSAVGATLLSTNPGSDTAGPSTLTINGTAQNCIVDATGTDEYGDFATIYIKGTIESGTIKSENQGLILSSDGTLDGTSSAVSNLDRLIVYANTAAESLTIQGTINNSGSIVFTGAGPQAALLVGDATATLQGGGTIELADGARNVIDGNGNSLINANNTISGNGSLGEGGLVLKNEGVVDATGGSPLFVDLSASTSNPASTNTGTL